MPCALCKRYKLDDFAIASDQQVRGHLEPTDFREIRMRAPVERIAEQRFNFGAAKFPRRQADTVQHQQARFDSARARVAIRAHADTGRGDHSAGRINLEFARHVQMRHDLRDMKTRLFVSGELINGSELELQGDRARYLGKVLRARVGDEVTVFNGEGPEWHATIAEFSKNRVTLVVGESHDAQVESPLRIHLVQGISRGDRMDMVVQKATELGVKRISPVLTEYGVVKLDEARAAKRQDHWQNIAISACEQSGRTRPPKVDPPVTLKQWFGGKPDSVDAELILAPGAAQALTSIEAPATKVCVLIGPEGGFSDSEYDDAAAAGFTAVSLGPRVLRTESAAIAALAVMQAAWGDLH